MRARLHARVTIKSPHDNGNNNINNNNNNNDRADSPGAGPLWRLHSRRHGR